MKIVLTMAIALFSFGKAFSQVPHAEQPFHLDLEARASEYEQFQPPRNFTDALDPILTLGKKNLDWLKRINSKRSDPLSFSSKETQRGMPIDSPTIYNAVIIQKSYSDLLSTLPKEISDVLVGKSAMTDTPPIDTDQYLNYGREIDRLYQLTVRWNSMKRYLAILVDVRLDDVRGYYFLNADKNLTEEFKNWSSLVPAKRAQMTDWLMQICTNADRDFDSCSQKAAKLSQEADLQAYYAHYFPLAESHWNDYFTLKNIRHDLTWSLSNPSQTSVPFLDPKDATILNYLKSNIEDEWHWNDWHLVLKFATSALTHVEFEAGQVPHVNGVGGSTITMDKNSPLTEYNVQWAIRHEYGHTLGFQDCYIEFYDISQEAIVSYQFDTTNLMCSRQGHFKETHYLALKQNYLK